jgi:anti-anti-sigma factor
VSLVAGFEYETRREGDIVRVVLTGEFDLSVVPDVEDELARIEADRPRVLAIDLSGISFMDSSGLRTLVSADARARAARRRLVIVRGPPPVHRVFEITKLEGRLEIVPDDASVPGS